MSEVKLISPLLDGFAMGNPMSEHDGVRCCPAIKENTDKKYIVKVISVPATQAQLDALLIAGAYKDPADAMEYFRQVGEGILDEAELLKTLSKLDGFLPYEGWQMVPITRRRLGYMVYLLGSYKRSLEKHIKSHPVTHLEAVNLGLDLCAALSVCRESGSLYVDLKPANVFVSEKKEYRIGDLGFIHLDALRYAALPEKYHSPYTPPELFDPMSSLNLTVDTYALGMILYQIYNDGHLPFKGKQPPEEALPSPINADYELAEIIMKAIDRDPDQRWTDPKEMGKALAEYMQRNAINDVPITPHTPLDVKPEDIVVIGKDTPEEAPPASEDSAAEVPESAGTTDSEEVSAEAEISEQTPAEALPEEAPVSVPEEDAQEVLPAEEEPVPAGKAAEAADQELSRMIAKADDLLSHEPEALLPPQPEKDDPFAFAAGDDEAFDAFQVPAPEDDEEESPAPAVEKKVRKNQKKFADPKYRRRKKRTAAFLSTAAVLALLGTGGCWYYQNLYLVPVNDLIFRAEQNEITVSIDSGKKDAAWVIKCIRPDGKTDTRGVSQGEATFAGLEPNTPYTIQVEIDGFHKLVGKISDVVTTKATTTILSFNSAAGPEDGSVVLSFEMEGKEPRDWAVYYAPEGGEEMRATFTGHSVTITGLSVGKVYRFRLETGENIALGGETSLEIMSPRLILAEDLSVSSTDGAEVTVNWKAPGDVVVNQWQVRCYNNQGYEQEVTVSEPSATFSGLDTAVSHTVEVTAAGMTQAARTTITANPLNVTALTVKDTSHNALKLDWEYTGEAPKDGWLLMYSLAGGMQNVIQCENPSAEISPRIPGAKYAITLHSTDGTTVFNSVHSYTVSAPVPFEGHGLTAQALSVQLLKTPQATGWLAEKQPEDAFTSVFASGEGISLALSAADSFYRPGEETNILYVIRDAYGNILPDLVAQEMIYWNILWNSGSILHAELDLPKAPSTPGEYVLELYFNGMTAAEIPFTIAK